MPWPNTELTGNLACCVLFKMWTKHLMPARVLCPSHLTVSCLCSAHVRGRAVALVASWFSLSGFGFGSKKGAEVSWRVSLTVASSSDHLTQGEGDRESTVYLSLDFTSLIPCFCQQTWKGSS